MLRNNWRKRWNPVVSGLLAGTLVLSGCSGKAASSENSTAQTTAEDSETVQREDDTTDLESNHTSQDESSTTQTDASVEKETESSDKGKPEQGNTQSQEIMKETILDTSEGKLQYYFYSAKENGYDSNRTDIMSPAFYIFAGTKTEEEANELVNELGMTETIQKWAGSICVVNPLEGSYGVKDQTAFLELVNSYGPAKNVKAVGIEEGATFVNNYISQECYFISGMMIYGGDMEESLDYMVPVPVYLSNGSQTAIDYYTKANQGEKLAIVETGTEKNLTEAFGNAWENILGKTYRIYNWTTEFYSSNIMDHTTPYELNEIVDFDALGIQYITCKDEKVTGMDGAYSWFEYVPESVLTMDEKTVPLVVSCHGNQNDPHIQGDTTGWPEMAAKEQFIVVSPEWQPKDINFTSCDGLGEDGVVALVGDLMKKYPQIDPSRVYISGLSAGGAFSFMMGIKHSDLFAAAAPVSGVNAYAGEIEEALKTYTGHGTPLLYMCGDYDFFQMIPVDGSSPNGMPGVWKDDPNVRIFSALQAYQKTLGLEVSAEPDMNANPYFGIALDNQQDVTLGEKQMYTGTLSNEDGVVMELGAIKDLPHWNYKPEAEYIWNFFSNYARDMETGEMVFLK